VATTAGLLLLLLSVPSIGPAIRAARDVGTLGTFTAGQVTCARHLGHQTCSWRGTFTPTTGHAERRDTTLYGAGQVSLRPGERIAAVDTGRPGRVYRQGGGSREWILTGILLLTGIALLTPLGRATISANRGRR
jgi:hypothetical protein